MITAQLKLMTKVQLINRRELIHEDLPKLRTRLRQIHSQHPDIPRITNQIRNLEAELETIEQLKQTAK